MQNAKRSFRFTFKLAKPADRKRIHAWLEQDYIREWIHGVGLKNTLEGLETFFKGGSTDQHWIAYEGKVPFAYLMTGLDGDDAITLDLFICEPDFLGKGLSVPMIQEFLISQFSNIKTVFIDPEATNTRAVHVYQKAGFKIIGEFIASWHPVLHYKMKLNMQDLLALVDRS